MPRSLIPNSTQIPDVILDHWMGHLSGAEFKVVMYIARRTYGFGKDSDTISLNQLARGIRRRNGEQLDYGTGLSRSSVKSACGSLVSRGVLVKFQATVEGSDEPDENTYRLNLYAPITLQDQDTSVEPKDEVGQKSAHVGQKSAHLNIQREVGQNLAHVGRNSAQGGSEIDGEVGQKLTPQETENQETDLQETAAAKTETREPNVPLETHYSAAAEFKRTKDNLLSSDELALVDTLLTADVNRTDAIRFAKTVPAEARRQLDYLPFKKDLKSTGAYLRSAIEGEFPPPSEYKFAIAEEQRLRKMHEEAERKQANGASITAEANLRDQEIDESILRLESENPAQFLRFQAFIETRRNESSTGFPHITEQLRARIARSFDAPEKRRELFLAWQRLSEEQQSTYYRS